jgi:hypothetical protein
MWNRVSVHLETLLVSVQNRYTVCTKRIIGSEIILGAPDKCTVYTERTIAQKSFWAHLMALPGYETQLEACFGPSRDSANLDVR